ncbi:MAG: hypothetical protein V1774_11100 [Candidatus Eisenbacteria bacterium]
MRTSIAVGALVLALFAGAAAQAEQVYLQANFDGKTIDQPIGTGGAAVGEPVSIAEDYIDTAVRATPMPTPCLEITDQDDYYAGAVRFELLDNVEITSGTVVVAADFWIPADLEAGIGCYLGVRESDGASHSFTNVRFLDGGSIGCDDAGGGLGTVGTYAFGELVRVIILFDLDEATYDLRVNGELLLDDQPHDVVGAGIGALEIGCESGASVGNSYFVDNIHVGDEIPTPVEFETWGGVKALFGGEGDPRDQRGQ